MRLLVFLFFLFCVPLTLAQGVQYTAPTSQWAFEKNYRGNTQEIDHCLIKNSFDNGTVFILAKNTTDTYRLALHFPHTNLVLGKSYAVDILIDDQKYVTATALVVTPSILAIALPSHSTMIEQMGRGSTLTISGPKDMVQFSLKGTAKAIKKLNSCKSEKRVEPTAQDTERLPLWLENVLLRIQMTDIKTIKIDNTQNLPLDYAWVTPTLFGGIKMISYDQTQTSADHLIGNYLNITEQLCAGDFLADPAPTKKIEATSFKPYDIVCSTDSGDTITSLLFGVEEKLLTVFFFEGDTDGKSLEKRNKLLHVLSE